MARSRLSYLNPKIVRSPISFQTIVIKLDKEFSERDRKKKIKEEKAEENGRENHTAD